MVFFALVGLLAIFFGRATVDLARDFVTRGKRLSRSTLDSGGVVTDSIAVLVAQAGTALERQVLPDDYALARMLRSEYGNGPVPAKIAMAWVALNDARALGRSLIATLNAGTRGGVWFGSQSGGRYSTAQDPYENDLAIAEAVNAGQLADPTGGAVKFVHKTGFASSNAYWAIVERWAADGLSPVELPDAGSLVVFVREGVG